MSGIDERPVIPMEYLECPRCGKDCLSIDIAATGIKFWIDTHPRFHKKTKKYCYRGSVTIEKLGKVFSATCKTCEYFMLTDTSLRQIRRMLERYPIINGTRFAFMNIKYVDIDERERDERGRNTPLMGRVLAEDIIIPPTMERIPLPNRIDIERDEYLRGLTRRVSQCPICHVFIEDENDWHTEHNVCMDCYNTTPNICPTCNSMVLKGDWCDICNTCKFCCEAD